VTDVYDQYGTRITLPAYPYAMPAARATLQSALRTAGHSGAVVTLYGDEWTIFLPDRPAANNTDRQFSLTYTPDDPYPAWDMYLNYLGNQSAAAELGTFGNVRPAVGSGVALEANKQFARLRIRAGTRYDPYL
jgi:hypothetical protein